MRLVFLLLLVTLSTTAVEAPTWHTDFAEALALAKKTDRPLFVVLSCRH
jgi:hypothetical protein